MTDSPVIRVIDCHAARETPEGWQYLVLRRAPGRYDAGGWRVVTGKIEDGETAWQAARRELQEETGLAPLRFFAVPHINQFYEWEHDRINAAPVFLATVSPDAHVTLDDEHDHHQWLPLEAAIEALVWPSQQDGLRAAAALITANRGPLDALEIDLTQG